MAKALYRKLKPQGTCCMWSTADGMVDAPYYRIVHHDGIRYYLTHSYQRGVGSAWRLTESRSGGAVGGVGDKDARTVAQVIRDLEAQVPARELVEAAVAKAMAQQDN